MEHLGLVGLPDSGHAQLFSALTGLETPGGFETTKGVAPLPDDRVDRLAEMSKSRKRVHATFEIDFIPGLAPGGKPGEGLGSRLLGSIRDCDAILAVVRADDDADPADALEALELELVLADLTAEEQALLGPVFLLTNKPMLVVVNVAVDRLDRADELAKPFGPDALSVCVEIEGDPDVAQAPPDERAALLADLGVHESVLPRLARGAYHLLGRRTFLTTGEDETRAWSFRAGAKAPECAGVIHSDLQRGFIRAEVIDWRELLDIGSWDKAKELGKLRVEGKEYEVLDGDVLEIRFNV